MSRSSKPQPIGDIEIPQINDFVSIEVLGQEPKIYVINEINDDEMRLAEFRDPEDIKTLIFENDEWVLDIDIGEDFVPYKIEFLGLDGITPYDIRNEIIKELTPIESDPDREFSKFIVYRISDSQSRRDRINKSEGAGPALEYGFKLIITAKTYWGAVVAYKDWLGQLEDKKSKKGKHVSNPEQLWRTLDIFDFIGQPVRFWPDYLDEGMDLLVEVNARENISFPLSMSIKSARKG